MSKSVNERVNDNKGENMDLIKIGQDLKNRRESKNWTIRDLSAEANVAVSTISQIETGKTSPNLLTLKAICDALGIPVFSLLLEDDFSNVRLVKRANQPSFVRNVSNGIPLTESLIIQGKSKMYAAIVDIPAHGDSGDYAHHGGEEFVFVLKGQINYDLENHKTYQLEEQDTLYYPNYIGHRWSNETDEAAQILMVSTSPYQF